MSKTSLFGHKFVKFFESDPIYTISGLQSAETIKARMLLDPTLSTVLWKISLAKWL